MRPSPTMLLEFSGPLSRKRLAFSIQALYKWCRKLQTHRRSGRAAKEKALAAAEEGAGAGEVAKAKKKKTATKKKKEEEE